MREVNKTRYQDVEGESYLKGVLFGILVSIAGRPVSWTEVLVFK